MNAKRHVSDYCSAILTALEKANVNVIGVVNAINGTYNEAELLKAGVLRAPSHTKATKKRASVCKVAETGSRYQVRRSVVTEFDDWACKFTKLSSFIYTPNVELPPDFESWLKKFPLEVPEDKPKTETTPA